MKLFRNFTNANSSTNMEGNPFHRSHVTIVVQVTSLALLGVVILLGNLASIVTFVKTQSLRRRCHYLLICLSVADFGVGIVDFMNIYFFLTGAQWNTFVTLLDFLDTLTGLASILTLSVISAERCYAILYPLKHRIVRFKFYIVLSAIPWTVAIVVSSFVYIAYFDHSYSDIYAYLLNIVITLALLVILGSYVSIGIKTRKNHPSAQNQNQSLRDNKLVVTLVIVTLSSIVTWLPMHCLFAVNYICKTCPFMHINVFFGLKFLQFSNSGLNLFIYILRMPEFRKAFLVLFCGKKTNNFRRQNAAIPRQNRAFTVDESSANETISNEKRGRHSTTSELITEISYVEAKNDDTKRHVTPHQSNTPLTIRTEAANDNVKKTRTLTTKINDAMVYDDVTCDTRL